jgi:hypothetical protein
MIESKYWKNDLINLANDLRPKRKPKRYSEKYHVNLEKRIILCFFIIRKLMELKSKLSENIYNYRIEVTRFPAKGNSFITKINDIFFEKHYYLDKPEKKNVDVNFICNQLIHHEIIYLLRNDNRNYKSILVCSGYEQDKFLYEINIIIIIEILLLVGEDNITYSKYKLDMRSKDYQIVNKK